MPTPPLPLLHQLLRVLHIPVFPPTHSSISPSLLLIILETLLGQPIPLSKHLRLCETPEAEICVVKCLLGVLAHDILALDLTLVDPQAIVDGSERELEVLIMAFAVVAKRRGFSLRLPKMDEVDLDYTEEGEESRLQDPIEPDVPFSSPDPGRIPAKREGDVFMDVKGTVSHRAFDYRASRQQNNSEHISSGSEDGQLLQSRNKPRTVLDEILEEFGP